MLTMLAQLAQSDEGVVIGGHLLFAIICAVIAADRGRSAVAWFFIGLFLSCFGLILVLVVPNLKEQEEREQRVSLENRRLREQLNKDRQVADQRQSQVERRLGAHDEALGLDTSKPPQLHEASAPAQLTNADQWFYARDGERQGPVSPETIRHLLAADAIDQDSLVWSQGMQDWEPLRNVELFRGDVS